MRGLGSLRWANFAFAHCGDCYSLSLCQAADLAFQDPFAFLNWDLELDLTEGATRANLVQDFYPKLKKAVRTRLPQRSRLIEPSLGRLAVLFSGGLDCSVLAKLAHETIDPHEPIDLLNVAFENPQQALKGPLPAPPGLLNHIAYESCPDRMTGRSSYDELRQVCPNRRWNFIPIVSYVWPRCWEYTNWQAAFWGPKASLSDFITLWCTRAYSVGIG